MLPLVHVNKRHHHFPSQFSNTRYKEVVKLSLLYFEYTFKRTVESGILSIKLSLLLLFSLSR